jgi:hypothetical protein
MKKAKRSDWKWSRLLIKLTSRQFWVWIITTYIVYTLLLIDGEHAWFLPLIIVWGVISVLYMGGNILIDALAEMTKKATLTISANTNISGNIGGGK